MRVERENGHFSSASPGILGTAKATVGRSRAIREEQKGGF
jgi:hypothetical protein